MDPDKYDGMQNAGGMAALSIIPMLIGLALGLLALAGMWKTFEKAGKPGWAAIVPIYNIVVMLEIIGKPVWWIVLLLIPCVSIVVLFMVMIALAERFGKGVGFGVGLTLLGFIFFPILGFGDAKFLGPKVLTA